MGGPGTTVHRALAERPAGLWFALFLFVNLAFDLGGGTNASSRFATLAAMAEDHSFSISRYTDWTADWARTPDGNYYSNKAPGPMLLGFPVYWVVDRVRTGGLSGRAARDQSRWALKFTALKLLSILFQILPFFWLTAAFVVWLKRQNCSPEARHLAVLLMLFGNTASLFLNSYYGHGMAATFMLGVAYGWVRRRPFWMGAAFGGAVLCDYGAAPMALPLLWLLHQDRHRLSLGDLSLIALGGLAPLLAWVVYHTACFGSPFSLPIAFENPQFQDVPGGAFGLLRSFPSFSALWQILAGGSRGLLWTNPWLPPLALSMGMLWRRHTPWADLHSADRMALGNLAFGGLILLVLLNASFGSWHGGQTPGPRYLSSVLPLFGPVAALAYDRLTGGLRIWLWFGVLAAVLLNALVFLSAAVPEPGVALWPYYLGKLFLAPNLTAVLRTGSLLLAGVLAFALFVRHWRRADLRNF